MKLLEWKDEFSVGVPSVDLEHRELIGLINETHRLASSRANYESISSMLGEIFAHVSAHFALEEKYMIDSAYPHYGEHKDDHERLLDEIRDIMDQVDIDGAYDERNLAAALETWFAVHFRTHDSRLHAEERSAPMR